MHTSHEKALKTEAKVKQQPYRGGWVKEHAYDKDKTKSRRTAMRADYDAIFGKRK